MYYWLSSNKILRLIFRLHYSVYYYFRIFTFDGSNQNDHHLSCFWNLGYEVKVLILDHIYKYWPKKLRFWISYAKCIYMTFAQFWDRIIENVSLDSLSVAKGGVGELRKFFKNIYIKSGKKKLLCYCLPQIQPPPRAGTATAHSLHIYLYEGTM